MFDFMPHILYNIIDQDSGLDMPCHVIQFLPDTPLLRMPYVRGIIILKHIIVIWTMTWQTKLSLTSIYFWALILPSTTLKVPTPS
jgi:hypothetical protein